MNRRYIAGERCYQSEGLTGLLQVKTSPGKPSKLPPDVLEGLRQRLQERNGFHSYGEIRALVGKGVQRTSSLPNGTRHCALQIAIETQSASSRQY